MHSVNRLISDPGIHISEDEVFCHNHVTLDRQPFFRQPTFLLSITLLIPSLLLTTFLPFLTQENIFRHSHFMSVMTSFHSTSAQRCKFPSFGFPE